MVREVPDPPAGGRALVRVAQAGLCGTDLKIAAGEIPVRRPRVMGHEMTGWVEAPGPRGLVPAGTRVLVNPAVWCGVCDLCRRDLPQLCRDGALLGRDVDGCFADYVAVDERLLHPIPDRVSADEGALLQVLSTCVHAQSGLWFAPGASAVAAREPGNGGAAATAAASGAAASGARASAGETSAVVVGLGVSGLLHVQLLRARGVGTIVGITRSAAKRELATASGATAVAAPDAAEDAVLAATGGRGADVAIECVGTAATLALTMRLAGAGGTVVAFGTTVPPADGLPTYQWYYKELTILSPRAARPRDCDEAVRLAAGRRLDLAPLVTARFPLEQAAAALAACRARGQLKVVLDIAASGAS